MDNGDKLACSVCHDPHAWKADGTWQAFFRKNWPTTAVPTQLINANRAIGSTYIATAATKYSAGSWSDASGTDSESRLLCIACLGNSDTVDAVFFSDINASFRNDRKVVRPTATVPEHANSQQVACVSCHVHNSVAASCTGCHGYPPSDTASVKYPAAPRSPYT